MRSSCICNVTMQFWSNSIVASNKLHYSIQTLVTSNTPGIVGEIEWHRICLRTRVEATTVECCTSIVIITLQVKNEYVYTKNPKQINILTQFFEQGRPRLQVLPRIDHGHSHTIKFLRYQVTRYFLS
jgi:hypothetical protein